MLVIFASFSLSNKAELLPDGWATKPVGITVSDLGAELPPEEDPDDEELFGVGPYKIWARSH